jgi:transglutaminase-like putative cysteine protease
MDRLDFLAPGDFIDSDTPRVVAFAQAATADSTGELDKVLCLYRAVRDGIVYDPYVDCTDPENYRASGVLAAGRAFCVGKAALLAAAARVVGVPARVGYVDVRNHLTSPRLYELIRTDVFIWHSYADLCLVGALGQSDASLRQGAVRAGWAQAARIRRTRRFAFSTDRPGRPPAYGISAEPRHVR